MMLALRPPGVDGTSRGQELIARTRQVSILALGAANVVGAVVIFLFLVLVLPSPNDTPTAAALRLNIPAFAVYVLVAVVVAVRWGSALVGRRLGWLAEGRPPDRREQRLALRVPLAQLIPMAVGWAGAAIIFGLLNLRYSGELAGRVAISLTMAGLATCALCYLVGERAFRDISARALETGPPVRPVAPGVVARAVLAWALATGVPVVGIAMVAIGILNGDTPNNGSTAWSVIVLAALALVVGAGAITAAARSIAEPIRSVRLGLAQVERNEQDVEVPVYDASEVGLLQAGFNRMAAGLREREQLRELFGLHVGEDVARQAIDSGVKLGGEQREAAVLFVDVVGSTKFALEADPQQVVDRLNAFFALVLEAVEEHDGWVNKFEGDAALCIFGVPVRDKDPAGRALAAARTLCDRIEREGSLEAGIGVSAGTVVAGNIGAAHRSEYTVIGDPVNEAARLTELAKQRRPRVLASGAALRRASKEEAKRWRLDSEVTLRGRPQSTRLAVPADYGARV
jgi:adenylate cyclase